LGTFASRRKSEQRRAGNIFKARVALGPDDPIQTPKISSPREFFGLMVGRGDANSRDRFIYIHGTKHEDEIGTPASHGCIRMRNADVIEFICAG